MALSKTPKVLYVCVCVCVCMCVRVCPHPPTVSPDEGHMFALLVWCMDNPTDMQQGR